MRHLHKQKHDLPLKLPKGKPQFLQYQNYAGLSYWGSLLSVIAASCNYDQHYPGFRCPQNGCATPMWFGTILLMRSLLWEVIPPSVLPLPLPYIPKLQEHYCECEGMLSLNARLSPSIPFSGTTVRVRDGGFDLNLQVVTVQWLWNTLSLGWSCF